MVDETKLISPVMELMHSPIEYRIEENRAKRVHLSSQECKGNIHSHAIITSINIENMVDL